ncbi:MAG: sulfite exporter TauE/SafE family protein, partial [Halobacteriovoraceae bacterium]|nr:sulfite exporter TauE/SafE family protein [Halobacteriovoraceae bacterium]
MLSPAIYIFLSVLAVATSIISAIVGMGGGIVLLSFMTFVLPLNIIIPVHGVVQLISNSVRCWFLKQHINRSILIYSLIGIPLGHLASFFIIKELANKNIPLLLISILIFYTIFKPKKLPQLKIPYWAFVFVGFTSGMLSLLIGATGPFLAPFFLRDDLNKENIIATKSAVQVLTHLGKIPAFLVLGFDYQGHMLLIVLLTLAAILGTKIGVNLLHKIDEILFKRIFKT